MAARPRRASGFTLVEVLVAISIMALLALMSWRGIDGMVRAQNHTRQHTDEVLALQASLAQWKADLDALAPAEGLTALDWDGRVLRLTRRSSTAPGDGLWVVAWTRRVDGSAGQWQRWQSPPLQTWGAWREAWARAEAWSQNASAEERPRQVSLLPLDNWQLFYYRGNAWTNPLSSDGTAATPVAGPVNALPDGVRLVLTLPPGPGLQGSLTLDWVQPTVGGGKS